METLKPDFEEYEKRHSQKEQGKKYAYLKGKLVDLFKGRVPTEYKRIEYEVSPTQKYNQYGDYGIVTCKIRQAHFNGKAIQITVSHDGEEYKFSIAEQDLSKLIFV